MLFIPEVEALHRHWPDTGIRALPQQSVRMVSIRKSFANGRQLFANRERASDFNVNKTGDPATSSSSVLLTGRTTIRQIHPKELPIGAQFHHDVRRPDREKDRLRFQANKISPVAQSGLRQERIRYSQIEFVDSHLISVNWRGFAFNFRIDIEEEEIPSPFTSHDVLARIAPGLRRPKID